MVPQTRPQSRPLPPPLPKQPDWTAIELFDRVFKPDLTHDDEGGSKQRTLFDDDMMWQWLPVTQLEIVIRSAFNELWKNLDSVYQRELAEYEEHMERIRAHRLGHAIALLWKKDPEPPDFPSQEKTLQYVLDEAFGLVTKLEKHCQDAGVRSGRVWDGVQAFRKRMEEAKDLVVARHSGVYRRRPSTKLPDLTPT